MNESYALTHASDTVFAAAGEPSSSGIDENASTERGVDILLMYEALQVITGCLHSAVAAWVPAAQNRDSGKTPEPISERLMNLLDHLEGLEREAGQLATDLRPHHPYEQVGLIARSAPARLFKDMCMQVASALNAAAAAEQAAAMLASLHARFENGVASYVAELEMDLRSSRWLLSAIEHLSLIHI